MAFATTPRAAAALAVVVTAGCGSDPTAVPPCTGGYHVCRGQVRDPDGRAVIVRGMNVSTEHKAAPYLGFHTAADLTRMRAAWGLNAMRWVMPWAAIEPSPGQYDDAYLDRVAERLTWAEAAGLAVVLDLHQDVYGEGFGFDGAPRWTCAQAHYDAFVPQDPWPLDYLQPDVQACFDGLWTDATLGARFAAAWAHVAARLGGQPAVLGFDVINEPHGGSYSLFDFERDRLDPFYQHVVLAVRAEAPHWLAFLEPAVTRNLGFPTSLEPFGFADVVYAPHLYDSQAEQGHGFDPARRGALIADVAAMRGEADHLGAALWLGEYGAVATTPGIDAYLDADYDGAAAVAASSMYWDYSRGGGYAPVDAGGAEVPAIIDAIVRPYPTRIAGDPLDWRYDPGTGALVLRWRPDPAIAAPTELIVPARLAGGGVTVACAGCAWTWTGDVVAITAPPAVGADGLATITIEEVR